VDSIPCHKTKGAHRSRTKSGALKAKRNYFSDRFSALPTKAPHDAALQP
jgi:hypothetical protein